MTKSSLTISFLKLLQSTQIIIILDSNKIHFRLNIGSKTEDGDEAAGQGSKNGSTMTSQPSTASQCSTKVKNTFNLGLGTVRS